MNNNSLAHLEKLWQDARDEIKRRIEQRDKYSIQMTIALGVLIAAAFSTTSSSDLNLRMVLLAVPLVSIYFAVLILYSYRVHDVLAEYLRSKIEPELAILCGVDKSMEWENYYHSRHISGIRGPFFYWASLILSALSIIYLWLDKLGNIDYIVLIVTTVLYSAAYLFILCYFHAEIFKKRLKTENNERLAQKT